MLPLGHAQHRGRGRCASREDDVLSLDATADHSASSGAQMMAAPQELSVQDQLTLILKSLEDDKAEEIVQIDLAGKSSIGDYMVVCSGRSSRQVGALAEKLVERLKEATGRTAKVEGKETGDWVLIDTGDVIVHVFRPEVREFYQIEKMWMEPGQKTPLS
ncbi:ribosome silencing factor [Pseudooceanicola marinus]|nr:ribosome silencing factor [Pseudooceanicola marinus]MCA1337661.1 ribosome silencing factor [Pseudooceanicola marinus]